MEAPQTEAKIPQEQEKKRSPWLVVLIIFLIFMMGCCIIGAILCRGTSRLPDLLDRIITEIPGDAWENPLEYTVNGNAYEIRSSGPDGQPNSEDDIMVDGV